MSWVRIHDGALSHPKIIGMLNLCDPFTLWVWGLSYSQMHLTDGVIVRDAIPKRALNAVAELVRRKLWEVHPSGWTVHDYEHWNDSREEVLTKREGLKKRVGNFRKKTPCNALLTHQRERVTSRSATSGVGISGSFPERESERKPDESALVERAGRLREELYPEWYAKWRHGARLRLVANSLEFDDALSLVRTWDDARLEKLAQIVLTTDEPFIAKTDRGFKIFAIKASWADDRLRQIESGAA